MAVGPNQNIFPITKRPRQNSCTCGNIPLPTVSRFPCLNQFVLYYLLGWKTIIGREEYKGLQARDRPKWFDLLSQCSSTNSELLSATIKLLKTFNYRLNISGNQITTKFQTALSGSKSLLL